MKAFHPARYHHSIVREGARLLAKHCTSPKPRILDPCAGTCERIAELYLWGFRGKIYCVELQEYWLNVGGHLVDVASVGDATSLEFKEDFFDAAFTSFTFANRMGDSHTPKNESKEWTRNTYTHQHMLATGGAKLLPNNSGAYTWGWRYRKIQWHICLELYRTMKPGGVLVLDLKNSYKNKGTVLVDVIGWHRRVLTQIGFEFVEETTLETPGQNQGANQEYKATHHVISVFRKREPWEA